MAMAEHASDFYQPGKTVEQERPGHPNPRGEANPIMSMAGTPCGATPFGAEARALPAKRKETRETRCVT